MKKKKQEDYFQELHVLYIETNVNSYSSSRTLQIQLSAGTIRYSNIFSKYIVFGNFCVWAF